MVAIAANGGILRDMRSCLQQMLVGPSLRTFSSIRRHSPIKHRKCRVHAGKDVDEEEPDWETEMSIFKKRTLRPSQMEALRKLEEGKVDVGRVLYTKDNVAIIEGLNNDADVGVSLSFSSGAKGVILWRRSDNIVFSLLLGGSNLVTIGDGVECRVRGILQVVDSDEGPSTKREYEAMSVPVGKALVGQIVDYLGRPVSENGGELISEIALGTDKYLPLLNAQPDMESREQITEALVTGVKALDVLTPLGRGQALQVSGTQGSGKTQLCIDAIIGQGTQPGSTRSGNSGVRCVYAAVGCSSEQLRGTVEQLKAHGCMEYTTVVAATADRPLGEQYAAMLAACSIAEATRDAGGHALVVLNDVSVMVRMWEKITVAMADLGSVVTEVQAAEVAELAVAAHDAIAEAGIDLEAEKEGMRNKEEDEEMIEYEGMLVSVAAAQRRRFFSSLIQRCAKMHRRLKGGSMSALLVVPGSPATGNRVSRQAKEKILKYKHLTEEQKAKLISALEKQSSFSNNKKKNGPKGPVPEELRTEVVEEFMSITDGQIVLRQVRDGPTGGVSVNPQLSVSRIGSRAYSPAVASLAPQVRFELAQAEDATKFSADKGSVAAAERAQRRAAVIAAALPQPQRTVCPLEVQVVHLLALKKGLLDDIPVSEVGKRLDALTNAVKHSCLDGLNEIAQTQRLTATAEAAISEALGSAQSTVSSSLT
ncbi:hypothetical protein Ndes2526A_g01433 [Nannochloris sp. 'desiccata']